jgi:hypothetical protein
MQSGKLGARGGVLSAYSEKLTNEECEAQIRDFATKCVQMVDHITQAGAQTQPPRQLALPRNEHSPRKQRRAAMKEEHMELMSQELAQTQDMDQQSELFNDLKSTADNDDAAAHQYQDDDARLASRLYGEAPAAEAKTAADEAQSEADASMKEDRTKKQDQEADALLDDLFGDGPGEKNTKPEENEDDSLPKKS